MLIKLHFFLFKSDYDKKYLNVFIINVIHKSI